MDPAVSACSALLAGSLGGRPRNAAGAGLSPSGRTHGGRAEPRSSRGTSGGGGPGDRESGAGTASPMTRATCAASPRTGPLGRRGVTSRDARRLRRRRAHPLAGRDEQRVARCGARCARGPLTHKGSRSRRRGGGRRAAPRHPRRLRAEQRRDEEQRDHDGEGHHVRRDQAVAGARGSGVSHVWHDDRGRRRIPARAGPAPRNDRGRPAGRPRRRSYGAREALTGRPAAPPAAGRARPAPRRPCPRRRARRRRPAPASRA